MPTCSAEDEVKKTMISQFQAQEKKVTDGLKEVQASSVHERTQLHKQLQDANVKLALAAEVILCALYVLTLHCFAVWDPCTHVRIWQALTKANSQTAEMSKMENHLRTVTTVCFVCIASITCPRGIYRCRKQDTGVTIVASNHLHLCAGAR
jgi:hypothetical protein